MEAESSFQTSVESNSLQLADRETLQPSVTWEHEELAQVRIKVLRGHLDSVQSCEFLQGDTKVLTASHDHNVKLWDFESGENVRTYQGHNMPVSQARAHPSSQFIASAGWDKKLNLWHTETGSVLWSVPHRGVVTCCSFSPDGQLLMTGTDLENTVRIFNIQDGSLMHELPDLHSSTITSCQFTPSGDRIITTSMDKTTRFWDMKTQKVTLTLKGHINVISDCCCTLDERKLVTVSWDKSIQVWDVPTGMFRSQGPRSIEKAHEGCISCCCVSDDGLTLVTGGYDQTVVVWDVDNMVQKLKLQGHTDWVEDVCISKDGKWLLSCGKDRTIRLWNIEDTDKLPVVFENRKSIGLKVITCSQCGKPFSMAQMENSRDLTTCVFCRLQTPDRGMPALAK